MELNEQIKKALETKDVKKVVTSLYDERCGDTYGDNIFEIIVEGYYCGCGSYSDEDTELIKKVFYYAAENRTEKFKDVIFNEYFDGEDRMAEMMMNILESVGLVEHGSTMRYPWLTDIGEALYAGLKDLERIEAEYKKENDWYDWKFDFSIVDNPYEEKKERTHYVPEVVKNMFDKGEQENNKLTAGPIWRTEGRIEELDTTDDLRPDSFNIGFPVTEDLDKEKQDWYTIKDMEKDGVLFFELKSLNKDEKLNGGLNRAQRRKRNKGKKD